MKYQVIWKASKPEYIGVGDTVETKTFGGVKEFESLKEIKKWNGDMSVCYGEENGFFSIYGYWIGEYQDLQDGSSLFISDESLHQQLNHIEE